MWQFKNCYKGKLHFHGSTATKIKEAQKRKQANENEIMLRLNEQKLLSVEQKSKENN